MFRKEIGGLRLNEENERISSEFLLSCGHRLHVSQEDTIGLDYYQVGHQEQKNGTRLSSWACTFISLVY